MARKPRQTPSNPMPADTGIYLSIVARDHAEFVSKIAELHRGFIGPEPKVTKAAVRAALNTYAAQRGHAAARKLVQKVCGLDVLSLSQIPPAKYTAVVNAIGAAPRRAAA